MAISVTGIDPQHAAERLRALDAEIAAHSAQLHELYKRRGVFAIAASTAPEPTPGRRLSLAGALILAGAAGTGAIAATLIIQVLP